MAIYRRADSKYWWLWLELSKVREKTAILVGKTITQQQDSKRLALEVYHQRMQELGRHIHHLPMKPASLLFSTYAKTFNETIIAHRRGVEREREILKHLLSFFGRDLLTSIDRQRVQAYQTARLQAPERPSKSTVNREVDLLKSMLREAVPKYLPVSPIAGMPRLNTTSTPKRILSKAEEARLLAVATHPQDQALLILGIDTLVRLSDLLDIRRSDRQALWLMIRDPKAGVPYQVPLSPRAVIALDAIPDEGPHYFAKFRRARNPRDWRNSVRQRLEYLCRLAKVPYGTLHGITFHGATRKTGATRLLVGKKEDLATVQRLGGWKSPEMLLRIYAEAEREDLLKAVGQSISAGARGYGHASGQ
jgi:integrase